MPGHSCISTGATNAKENMIDVLEVFQNDGHNKSVALADQGGNVCDKMLQSHAGNTCELRSVSLP